MKIFKPIGLNYVNEAEMSIIELIIFQFNWHRNCKSIQT